MWTFDLDGTLVDTRCAVETAYLAVGVKMPDQAWGRPWQEWLKDEERHRRKNTLYPISLALYGRRLPLMEHAIRLQAWVITGASGAAVTAVREVLEPRLRVALYGATIEEKAQWLSRFKAGIYVDDDPIARQRIADVSGWRVISPEQALEELS